MSSFTSGLIKVDVEMINSYGREADVLFINEQKLVTFGNMFLSMIPEYYVMTLMEMAMSDNEAHLDWFFDDLESKCFDAIVAWRQTTKIKGSGRFIEKNNTWNSLVSPFILCTYRPGEIFEIGDRKIVIYVPHEVLEDCPR